MLPHLEKILDDDLRQGLCVEPRGCSDCPNALTCQTTGKPGEQEWFWCEQEPMVVLPPGVITLEQLKNTQYDVIKAMHDKNMGDVEPTHVGVHSTFVKNCARPLGVLQRTLVPVNSRHEYFWYSPCVPLRVKLEMVVEMVDKLYALMQTTSETRVIDRGTYKLDAEFKKYDKDALGMIHEVQRAFAAGAIPMHDGPRDTAVWEAFSEHTLNKTEPFTSFRSCLAIILRACCFNELFEFSNIRIPELKTEERVASWYDHFVSQSCRASGKFANTRSNDNKMRNDEILAISQHMTSEGTISQVFQKLYEDGLGEQVKRGVELLKKESSKQNEGEEKCKVT
jgi:hypothetical protein